jgi:adenylate cyclase class 2
MYEVELKVRADHARVREALDARDAERLGRVRQVDTYYDAPHRAFAETDEALRIRRETDGSPGDGVATTKLAYKGPLVETESKSREEHETVVADGEAMAGVLSGLGFEPAATVEKLREYFRLGEYTLTLDRVEGLGEFVEIERAVGGEAAVEAAREEAAALLQALDLDPAEQIRTSYLGLLLEADATDD